MAQIHKDRAQYRAKARCLTCGSLVNHGSPPSFEHNGEPRYYGTSASPYTGGVGLVKLRRRYCNDDCMALQVVVQALKAMP